MTVVNTQSTLRKESSALPLAKYAYLTGYPECRFWGVSNANDESSVCREILTKAERDMIARYLAEAQDEIENVVKYRLNPTWEASEEHTYANPVNARWGMAIAPGVKGESVIQSGAAVSHAADPAVIGPIATTVTNEDEVYVFHPSTDVEINPSSITISGGFVTIEIPRCRMVTEAAYSTGGSIDYTVAANFESTVDVKRIYNDTSTQAELVWTHSKKCCCIDSSCCTCSEETETACIGIRNARASTMNLLRADYSGGTWTTKSIACSCTYPNKVRLNYYAGLTPITPQVEDTILRLAHSKMPEPPCGCSVLQDLWKRDRNTPTVLTAERMNCPFGLSDGAWIAWQFAQTLRVGQGAIL